MDIRTGETYATKEEALAAGVPESDIAQVKWGKREPYPEFTNTKHPIRHQGSREMRRRMKQQTGA